MNRPAGVASVGAVGGVGWREGSIGCCVRFPKSSAEPEVVAEDIVEYGLVFCVCCVSSLFMRVEM